MLNKPTNLTDLAQLAQAIRQQQVAIHLGEKSQKSLAYLIRHPENTALHSITVLAAELGVHASTLTRLVKRLGFEGFADFQRIFRHSLRQQNTDFYSRQASQQLRQWPAQPNNHALQRLEQLAQENISNIQHGLAHLNMTDFIAAARCIAQAKRVRIYGLRQYSALAQFLSYGLGLIRNDVACLDNHHLGAAEALAQLESHDVLISASVNPYTQQVVQISQLAAQSGLTVISLSDTPLSPLATIADYAFAIPYHSSFFSNSISAYFVFAEGLLNQVAWELGDAALAAITRREQFITDLGIEFKA